MAWFTKVQKHNDYKDFIDGEEDEFAEHTVSYKDELAAKDKQIDALRCEIEYWRQKQQDNVEFLQEMLLSCIGNMNGGGKAKEENLLEKWRRIKEAREGKSEKSADRKALDRAIANGEKVKAASRSG